MVACDQLLGRPFYRREDDTAQFAAINMSEDSKPLGEVFDKPRNDNTRTTRLRRLELNAQRHALRDEDRFGLRLASRDVDATEPSLADEATSPKSQILDVAGQDGPRHTQSHLDGGPDSNRGDGTPVELFAARISLWGLETRSL